MNFGNLHGAPEERILWDVCEFVGECEKCWRRLRWVYGLFCMVLVLCVVAFFLGATGTLPVEEYVAWNVLTGFEVILVITACLWWMSVKSSLWKTLDRIKRLHKELHRMGRSALLFDAAEGNPAMARALREIQGRR
ncbi:MAG: hypothetical protein HYY10_00680 [Candidatus Liptonbacteria bacterium]|nr:hypothetical protein [Candidatus Liptonbacteria bacterium]